MQRASRRSPSLLSLAIVLASIGCADEGARAPVNEGAVELVRHEWELAARSEGYICVRKTMERDLYIREMIPLIPRGTHHTVLSLDDGRMPDGAVECNGFEVGTRMLFGSGVGTEPLVLPEGLAVKVERGQQLLLNLHLFNVSDATLRGASGIEVRTVPGVDLAHQAEAVLMGKTVGLRVPPRTESTQTGHCAFDGPSTVFAVMPHMHTTATHMKVTATIGGAPRVLHDESYNFDDQRFRMIDPMTTFGAGDHITVDCTYNNPDDQEKRFGESTNDEMCFAAIYRFPSLNRGPVCDDALGR